MSVSFNNNNTAPKYDAHAFAVTTVPASEGKKNSSVLSGGFAMQLFRPFRSVSFTSPRTVMLGGCVELMVLLYFFSQVRILEGDYFRWGVPLVLFQYEITGTNEFICILAVFFLHQITYTWITETLNPWLLNEVQDHKCSSIRYTKPTTVSVINLYQAYLTLNNILVLNIAFSQVSFLVIILVADFISHTLINLRYIWHKNVISDTPQKKESDIEAQLLEFKNGYCPIPDPYTLKVVVSKP